MTFSSRPDPLNRLDFYRAVVGSECRCVSMPAHFPIESDMLAAPGLLSAAGAVFALPDTDGTVALRCFSPAGEVMPDTAALICAFTLLRDMEKELEPGTYNAATPWGYITVNVAEELIWLEVPSGTISALPEDGPLQGFTGPDGREFVGGKADIEAQSFHL